VDLCSEVIRALGVCILALILSLSTVSECILFLPFLLFPTAPMSDSGFSSAGISKIHRPILLSAAAVAEADGDPRFVDLSSTIIPPLRPPGVQCNHRRRGITTGSVV